MISPVRRLVAFLWVLIVIIGSAKCAEYAPIKCSNDTECDDVKDLKCIRGYCHCREGELVHSEFTIECVKCPTIGQMCVGQCCSRKGESESVQCWNGVCRNCFDNRGVWMCPQRFAVSNAIILGMSLFVGIFLTCFVIFQLCPWIRVIRNEQPTTGHRNQSRLSVGSLQVFVQRRLRDAPPKYTRSMSSAPVISSRSTYNNDGFVHDYSSRPPPLYTEVTAMAKPPTADAQENLHM